MDNSNKNEESFTPDSQKLKPVSFDNSQKHKNTLEKISTWSVWIDLGAKIIVFIGFIVYAAWQIHSINSLINDILSKNGTLEPSIIITYIKYSLGFNSALILILGYWFGSNGGFSKLIARIVSSIIDKK